MNKNESSESILFDSLETEIIKNSDIEVEIAKELKKITNNKIQKLYRGNEFREMTNQTYPGITSKTVSKLKYDQKSFLTNKFKETDYIFFTTDDNNDNPLIGVIKSNDDFELIRLRATNGLNYDITSENIIVELTNWRKEYDFKIIGLGADWIELEFDKAPEQNEKFKEMVYKLCPDAIDWIDENNGILLMEPNSKYLNLWWD